jgi:hypothetical protein
LAAVEVVAAVFAGISAAKDAMYLWRSTRDRSVRSVFSQIRSIRTFKVVHWKLPQTLTIYCQFIFWMLSLND